MFCFIYLLKTTKAKQPINKSSARTMAFCNDILSIGLFLSTLLLTMKLTCTLCFICQEYAPSAMPFCEMLDTVLVFAKLDLVLNVKTIES